MFESKSLFSIFPRPMHTLLLNGNLRLSRFKRFTRVGFNQNWSDQGSNKCTKQIPKKWRAARQRAVFAIKGRTVEVKNGSITYSESLHRKNAEA